MTHPRTPVAPEPRPAVRNTASELAELARRYPEWADRFTGDEPVYSIPLPAIECLARPIRAGGPPLFDAATVEAEQAFTQVCEENHVVGVWADSSISFPFLSAGRSELGAGAAALNWSSSQLNTVRELLAAGDEARRRLRGVIGWLLTEPAFLAQVAEIRRLYQAVPTGARPRFPLGRLLLAPGADGGEPFRAFADGLVRFLDRWGLMNLASWDLPNPQGSLLPNLLPEGSPARPAHGVWVYVPVHYPLQGDDALQRQIVGFQRSQVAAQGIDPSFAGNTHHETYERMFRVIHPERAIRRRFDHPPRGLVGRIEAALHLSADRVQRLRKMITRCRAGRRASVAELCVRD
jgi:hypothetical protein